MKAGLIAINLAAIIFGTAALFGKLPVSPVWIVALRGAFACIALLLLGLIRGGLVAVRSKAQIKALIMTGVLLAVHWLTFFASVQLAGVAIATLTFAAFPLFTVILVAWSKRKVPTPLEIGAGIAILIAVGMLVDIHADGLALLGAVSGFVSAIAFAYFGIKAKRLTGELPPLTVSLGQNLSWH
ncbi:MAG: DMT family transporter [Bdellovibrio sp.]|nr:DMT family transporter [Bdellovibrio sp.]